jgi:hypothetical protein
MCLSRGSIKGHSKIKQTEKVSQLCSLQHSFQQSAHEEEMPK